MLTLHYFYITFRILIFNFVMHAVFEEEKNGRFLWARGKRRLIIDVTEK